MEEGFASGQSLGLRMFVEDKKEKDFVVGMDNRRFLRLLFYHYLYVSA
jgi:hypothetical protein